METNTDNSKAEPQGVLDFEIERKYIKFITDKSHLIDRAVNEAYIELSGNDIKSKGEFEREATSNIRNDFLSGKLSQDSDYNDIKNSISNEQVDLVLSKDSISTKTKKAYKLRRNSSLPFFSRELELEIRAITSGANPTFHLDAPGKTTYADTLSELTYEDENAREQLRKGEKPDSQAVRFTRVANTLGITEEALSNRVKKLYTMFRSFHPINFSTYYKADHFETYLKAVKHLQSSVFNFPEKINLYLKERVAQLENDRAINSYEKLAENLNSNNDFRKLVLSKNELAKGAPVTPKILKERILQPITRRIRQIDNMLRSENVFLLRENGVEFSTDINGRKKIKEMLVDMQSTYESELLNFANKNTRKLSRAKPELNSKAA